MQHNILSVLAILPVVRALPTPANVNPDISTYHDHRAPRELRRLILKDPLDCLSQVICGLNTYPPLKPSVRTSTANDFAFLLKSAISKLRSQTVSTKKPTTTTAAPVPSSTTKKATTKAPLKDDDYDEDENDVDYEADDMEDDRPSHSVPPSIPIDKKRYRLERASGSSWRRGSASNIEKKNKFSSDKRSKKKSAKSGIKSQYQNQNPIQMLPILTPLDRLRMETNLRAKLISTAQCARGLTDHTCPFNYDQMLSLMSSSLERERTLSYNTGKVLPMVGYLIKSRNYTGTLEATFKSIEKINNYTFEADREGKPIDFSHILDEVIHRLPGDNGIRIVDTSNDSGSTSVWEDDEFDHVLENPYVKRPASVVYKLPEHKKLQPQTKPGQGTKVEGKGNKKAAKQADGGGEEQSSEEESSEEGFGYGAGPFGSDNESSSEEGDDKVVVSEANKKEEGQIKQKRKYSLKDSKDSLPPPVFGHLRKSAEDE